jgi:hypothetical protein
MDWMGGHCNHHGWGLMKCREGGTQREPSLLQLPSIPYDKSMILQPYIRNLCMDGITLNCYYLHLHILGLSCSQIVYWYLSDGFSHNISIYTIQLMTANQALLLIVHYFCGCPVNCFAMVQIYTYSSTRGSDFWSNSKA